MRLLLLFVAAGIGLYALHRLALWMESRDWIYYQRSGDPASLGDAFLEVQSAFSNDAKHLLEARRGGGGERGEAAGPDDVRRKVERMWLDADARERAWALLDRYGEGDEAGRARVQLAALKLCEGSLDALERWIETARQDFRDLLAYAEYPEETNAGWTTAALSDAELLALAASRERDRRQYLDWLHE
jgi:hypothetical protein